MSGWACRARSLLVWLAQPGADCVDAWLGRRGLVPVEPRRYVDGTPVRFADPATQALAEYCCTAMQPPAPGEGVSARFGRPAACWVDSIRVLVGDEIALVYCVRNRWTDRSRSRTRSRGPGGIQEASFPTAGCAGFQVSCRERERIVRRFSDAGD